MRVKFSNIKSEELKMNKLDQDLEAEAGTEADTFEDTNKETNATSFSPSLKEIKSTPCEDDKVVEIDIPTISHKLEDKVIEDESESTDSKIQITNPRKRSRDSVESEDEQNEENGEIDSQPAKRFRSISIDSHDSIKSLKSLSSSGRSKARKPSIDSQDSKKSSGSLSYSGRSKARKPSIDSQDSKKSSGSLSSSARSQARKVSIDSQDSKKSSGGLSYSGRSKARKPSIDSQDSKKSSESLSSSARSQARKASIDSQDSKKSSGSLSSSGRSKARKASIDSQDSKKSSGSLSSSGRSQARKASIDSQKSVASDTSFKSANDLQDSEKSFPKSGLLRGTFRISVDSQNSLQSPNRDENSEDQETDDKNQDVILKQNEERIRRVSVSSSKSQSSMLSQDPDIVILDAEDSQHSDNFIDQNKELCRSSSRISIDSKKSNSQDSFNIVLIENQELRETEDLVDPEEMRESEDLREAEETRELEELGEPEDLRELEELGEPEEMRELEELEETEELRVSEESSDSNQSESLSRKRKERHDSKSSINSGKSSNYILECDQLEDILILENSQDKIDSPERRNSQEFKESEKEELKDIHEEDMETEDSPTADEQSNEFKTEEVSKNENSDNHPMDVSVTDNHHPEDKDNEDFESHNSTNIESPQSPSDSCTGEDELDSISVEPKDIESSDPSNKNNLKKRKSKNLILFKKLISFVERNQVLYNPNHRKFRDQKAKLLVWEKIANSLNSNVQICQSIWFDLRKDYQKYVRQMRRFLLTRNKAKRKRPLHPFENEMCFLWRFITKRSSAPLPYEVEEDKVPDNLAIDTINLDDDVQVIEKPIDVIEIDDDDNTTSTPIPRLIAPKGSSPLELNKSHLDKRFNGSGFRISREVYKLIENVRVYPDLYNASCSFYKDYKRKGIIWSSIANELSDKATKLMKCWFILYTRYEWEYYQYPRKINGRPVQTARSELETALSFLEKYVDKNPNSVYKQSRYLSSRWFDAIDNFKSIYNLLGALKRFPRIINLTEECLITKTADMKYYSSWAEIAVFLNSRISAGQCETTWLMLRNFYWELINMRKNGYQLQDKWYFEVIITDLYRLAAEFNEVPTIEEYLDEDNIKYSKIANVHAKGGAANAPKQSASGSTNNTTASISTSAGTTIVSSTSTAMTASSAPTAVTVTPIQVTTSTTPTIKINHSLQPKQIISQPIPVQIISSSHNQISKAHNQNSTQSYLRKIILPPAQVITSVNTSQNNSISGLVTSIANTGTTGVIPTSPTLMHQTNNSSVSSPVMMPKITSACSLAPSANLIKNVNIRQGPVSGTRPQIQIKTANQPPPPLIQGLHSTKANPTRPTLIVKSTASLTNQTNNFVSMSQMPILTPKPQQIGVSVPSKLITTVIANSGSQIRTQNSLPANVFTQIATNGPVPIALTQTTLAQPKTTYISIAPKVNQIPLQSRSTLQGAPGQLLTSVGGAPTIVSIQSQAMTNQQIPQAKIQLTQSHPTNIQPILSKSSGAMVANAASSHSNIANIRTSNSPMTNLVIAGSNATPTVSLSKTTIVQPITTVNTNSTSGTITTSTIPPSTTQTAPILTATSSKMSTPMMGSTTPTMTSGSSSTKLSGTVTITDMGLDVAEPQSDASKDQKTLIKKSVIPKSGSLGTNEVMIELIAMPTGNFLVIEGPMLRSNYMLSMPKVAKFIREVISIPLLHNKNYKNAELMLKYWNHISKTFHLPVSICRACWNFLSENFQHFAKIAPLNDLMKPVKLANFKVWQESHELFKNFNSRAVDLGWLKYAPQLPDVMEAIERYPRLYIDIIRTGFKLSSHMENIDPEKANLIIINKFPSIPDVMAIWKAFKDVFLRYMIDLEYGIENRWPHNWWRALAKCNFLMEARYHDMQPFYYIVKHKIIEEIERRTQFENKMIKIGNEKGTTEQIEMKPALLKLSATPGVKLKLRDDIDAYDLLVTIRKYPKVYEKCGVEEKQEAWHNVAKELKKSINSCRLTFQYALKTYRRYKKRDTSGNCLISAKYFKHFEEIERAVRSQQSKISIKTPSQLNQQADDLDQPTGFVNPEYYVPEIHMRTSSPGVVVKNWAYAVGTLTRYDQGLLEPKLRALFAKYGSGCDTKKKP